MAENSPTAELPQDTEPAPAATTTDVPASTPPSSGMVLLSVAGVVAALVAAPIVEHFYESFPMISLTPEETNLLRADPNDPVAWAIERSNRWAWLFKNAAFGLCLFGAILGACLGFAEGLRLRSVAKALLFAISLVVFGAVAGVLAGLAEASFALRVTDDPTADPTMLTFGMHVAAFVIIGLGVGGGLMLMTRSWKILPRTAGAGLAAGLLFLPLATTFFPIARTDFTIPETLPAKFLFFLLSAGLIGLSAGRAPLKSEPAK